MVGNDALQKIQAFIFSDVARVSIQQTLNEYGIADDRQFSLYKDITSNVLQVLVSYVGQLEFRLSTQESMDILAELQKKYNGYIENIKPELLHQGVIDYFKTTKWEPEELHTFQYRHEGRVTTITVSLGEIDINLKNFMKAKILQEAAKAAGFSLVTTAKSETAPAVRIG